MKDIQYELLHGGSLILLYMIVILASKLINDLISPYHLDDELTEKDNVALSTSICGYFTAVTVVFMGALIGPSSGILKDLMYVGGYAFMGIVLLNISQYINDKLILYKFSNVKEIIVDRNTGTGAVQFGSYTASGMIVAGSLHGGGGGIHTALVFFLLGQVAMIAFTWVYNYFLTFDIHDEIEKDNVAAGIAFGGTLIALGIILMRGVSGNFVSWSYNLTVFGTNVIVIFIYLPVVRFFFDKVMIPKTTLDHEIKNDRNIGAALLEASTTIGFATVLFFAMA